MIAYELMRKRNWKLSAMKKVSVRSQPDPVH